MHVHQTIRNYDSSFYIGIDPGREIIKNATSVQLAYQETDSLALCSYRTRRQDGHLNVLFQSSNCLLQENKKARVLPRPQANSSPSSSSSSNSSRASTTRDRNGFKERKLYQLL